MPSSIELPAIVETQDETYAFIHSVLPRAEMHAKLPSILQELHGALTAQGLPIQPWFAHYLSLSQGACEFESCLPVDSSFMPRGRVVQGIWPAGTVARTVYQGDYLGLPAAWAEFGRWIVEGGHVSASHIYERYVVNRHRTQNPTELRTELSWPLIRSTAKQEQA